ncbi:polysaccharide deacetylase family protein [Echinicola shivajiensis]|uniref:polysaccharide deacetylase family protein n=1 Tax=Echinicola shivajiensis TaxID=1035916 RepID=UPI001BFC925E|nr:polysaccharide deacetylase family protein [Echinicola shivajiensis]
MKDLLKLIFICFLSISMISCSHSKGDQGSEAEAMPQTWAEKLGYPAGKKVIILHADDAGMCPEANEATMNYLNNDFIQSAAAMPPCPNFDEFIAWAKESSKEDIGLHLTLTSEWKTHRWGPVSNPKDVPSLLDPQGMLWPEVPDVVRHAALEDVEKEIRAQIEKSIALGYRPNHIDTHMGTLYGHKDYVNVFFKVAEEYNIPANVIDLNKPHIVEKFRRGGYPIDEDIIALANDYSLPKLDDFTSAPNADTYEEKVEKFKALVRSLDPGITEIIFHPSTDTENLKTITNSWKQRVWEAKMFGDPDLIQFFEEEGIIFTNWKEVMGRFESLN